ncbi:hypothetical protein [Streptomyces benahoarensis]|uniref:hypothetical protein n=1 Tax=Streptomyces benahoarensis TaxID=2595054 RepID=UPI00163DD237|nr:hypothetical protein [Streptomyces benahoarensis]
MNANQQHLLDAYRAAQRGEAPPVQPGTDIVRTVREVLLWRRFTSVVTAPADRFPARVLRTVRSLGASLLHPRPLHRDPSASDTAARPAAGHPVRAGRRTEAAARRRAASPCG